MLMSAFIFFGCACTDLWIFLLPPSPWRLHCSFDGILALKIMFIMLFDNFFTSKLDPITCSFYLLFKCIGLKQPIQKLSTIGTNRNRLVISWCLNKFQSSFING